MLTWFRRSLPFFPSLLKRFTLCEFQSESNSFSKWFTAICARHLQRSPAARSRTEGGCLLMALCAVPVTVPSGGKAARREKLESVDRASLGHRSLLRNAASAAVTAASALVSQSLLTLNELNTAYVEGVYTLVKLYDEHDSVKNLGTIEDDLWQEIIGARAELEEAKQAMQEVEAVLSSGLKVLDSAGEAAYHAGVEYSALEAKTRHQQVTEYLSLIQTEARNAETKLTKIKAKNIEETDEPEGGVR